MQGFGKIPDREKYNVISPSALILFREDPELYKMKYIDKVDNTTKSMEFGTLVHMAILEPFDFADKYCTAPPVENDFSADELKQICREMNLAVSGTKAELVARIKCVNPEFKTYDDIVQAACAGKTPLPINQYNSLMTIRDKVMLHPKIGEWIKQAKTEALAYYQYSDDLLVSFKPDAFLQFNGVGIGIDIKVCMDWDENKFMRNNYSTGRHIQAAFYIDGLSKLVGYNIDEFLWIAIEPVAPHRVRFYQADFGMIEAGRQEIDFYMKEFLDRKKRNNWEARPQDLLIKQTSLSEWDWQKVTGDL